MRMDKLQRAGRDFLMRLVAQHGLHGAARVLWALEDKGAETAATSIERKHPHQNRKDQSTNDHHA